jgi:hypothetical protein
LNLFYCNIISFLNLFTSIAYFYISGMNIGWKVSWSKRKESGADLERKYEDSEQKYKAPKSEAWHGPCHLTEVPFAAFALAPSYSVVVLPKSPCNCLDFKSNVSYK